MTSRRTLVEVWRYPIKSCIGISLDVAMLDESGIVGDREYVVTRVDGTPLTQRNAPKLNLISVHVDADTMRVSAPNRPDLEIDVSQGQPASVKLNDGPAPGLRMPDNVSAWLTAHLGQPCQLVKSHQRFERRISPLAAHMFLKEQYRYPDCAPIQIIGSESLADLNRRLPQPVEMSRFRPNLVVDGLEPFEEDRLRTIRIGNVVFEYMGLSERCVIPTIAPGTDQAGSEPLETLRSFRMVSRKLYTGIAFGAYFKPTSTGELHLGDRVEILEVGESPEMKSC